jgi:hypothetical protein
MTPTEDDLRHQVDELRTELDLISGGCHARTEHHRELNRQLENTRNELALIRGELGVVRKQRNALREELGIVRNQRNALREEVGLAQGRRQQVVKLLDDARTELAEARSVQRIDGLQLFDVICDVRPAGLVDEDLIAKLALDAVDALDRVTSVTVFRGNPNDPWRAFPRDTPDATPQRSVDMCAPPPDEDPNRWVQYAVLIGPRPGENTCRIVRTGNYRDADFLARHIPGSWIAQRATPSHNWTPAPAPKP